MDPQPRVVTRPDGTSAVAALAELLRETAERHDPVERAAPPHDWWDWYAPYIHARSGGAGPEEAAAAAGRYLAAVTGTAGADPT